MRMSVATWSFLDRPVCSFPAVCSSVLVYPAQYAIALPTRSRANELGEATLVGGVDVLVVLPDVEGALLPLLQHLLESAVDFLFEKASQVSFLDLPHAKLHPPRTRPA